MIFAKPNNYGVDAKIYDLQRILDTKLSDKWNGEYGIYGRIEKLTKSVEVYSTENEYIQPFFNDKQSASIAFDVTGYNAETNLKADVTLICTCLLDRIFGNNERNDQKALMQLHRILKYSGILDIVSLETGKDVIDNIGLNYPHKEMHPWFIFSISFKTIFVNNSCK